MANIAGGAGGLFSGFSQGLQILLALRQAEEDRKLRERNTVEAERRGAHETAMDLAAEERQPFQDIQKQLNAQNITAPLGDIRREYTPPAEADTFQPTTSFAPPAFGAGQTSGPPQPVQDLNTSHVAQVLERANRRSMHQRKIATLTDLLTQAGTQAQKTQVPVSGAFGPTETVNGQQVRPQLPENFTAQPDRTFSPVQMGVGKNPEADRLARLITMVRARIPPQALLLLDTMPPGQVAKMPMFRGARNDIRYLVELTAQYARAINAPEGERAGEQAGGAGGATKSPEDWVNEVTAEHPNWSAEQVAAEAKRRAGVP